MASTQNTQQMANAIRALAMDAVQAANSGHPGAPMGMADMAVALWGQHLSHNPTNPNWLNRDRFVLSNGHGSMLMYALLHLTGYKLPMSELKNFRTLHSKTAGHPEVGVTPGVETTTGPLGQGITNAVGMALAEKLLASEFNRKVGDVDHAVVDHHTYVFMGDGCLMEGISHEAAALAGAWKLGKLIALYDDNGISIDGQVAPWFIDNTAQRFVAYGWNVIGPVNGNDAQAVSTALAEAKQPGDRPTLIICKTAIGFGSPNRANTSKAHGEPLGTEEIALTRAAIGWSHAPFVIPKEVYADWDAKAAGKAAEQAWKEKFAAYQAAFPVQAKELLRRMKGDLPKNFVQTAVDTVIAAHTKAETVASRKASQLALEAFTAALPELLGGSADLTGSNLTNWSGSKSVTREGKGNYIHYGVREFGMAAIVNGIALHGGFIPYGGTFLMFSEYARNALRMAALMKQRSIFVFTHDSIGLGEDGPTHQPVEQIASLRLIPNMDMWRPCDTVESAVAWASAIERRDGPTCMAFSRQNLPFVKRKAATQANIRRGGYVLVDSVGAPKVVLLATGSEVDLALKAQAKLADEGIPVRVVSMPCTNIFDRQDAAYRASVLPKGVPTVAVEAGVTDGWYKYVGLEGAVIGLDRFGESAPAGALFKEFGFTVENVVETVKGVI